MIPHERAKSLATVVYTSGLKATKASLSEAARRNDPVSRKLLNAIGLFEQGVAENVPQAYFASGSKEPLTAKQTAGVVKYAVDERRRAIRTAGLVEAMLNGMSPDEAVKQF